MYSGGVNRCTNNKNHGEEVFKNLLSQANFSQASSNLAWNLLDALGGERSPFLLWKWFDKTILPRVFLARHVVAIWSVWRLSEFFEIKKNQQNELKVCQKSPNQLKNEYYYNQLEIVRSFICKNGFFDDLKFFKSDKKRIYKYISFSMNFLSDKLSEISVSLNNDGFASKKNLNLFLLLWFLVKNVVFFMSCWIV